MITTKEFSDDINECKNIFDQLLIMRVESDPFNYEYIDKLADEQPELYGELRKKIKKKRRKEKIKDFFSYFVPSALIISIYVIPLWLSMK